MKSNNRYMPLVFVLIIVGIVLSYLLNTARQSSGEFCSPEDALYRTLSAHASEWWGKYFRDAASATTFDFSSENGQRFTAIKENVPDPIFFVVVAYDYPHTYFEHKGYLYAPNNIHVKRNEYRYTDMGKGIYCYEEA